jgi:glycosyltransferase involved in cell wall biosynthesis
LTKLLVVNQYYAPDLASSGQLLAELCEALAASGMEVHVVASQPSYTDGAAPAPDFEVLNGVNVHRVSVGASVGRERMKTRVAGYVKFMFNAWRKANSIAQTLRPDTILTLSNPPSVGLIGARVSRKHDARYVYVLYDIHPDVAVAMGFARIPAPAIWAWHRMNQYILRRADTVVVPGHAMVDTLVEEKGVPRDRALVIPNWGRPEIGVSEKSVALRRELGVEEGELMLLYAGNIGILQQLDPILDAAGGLKEKGVKFIFLGDGARREELNQRAEREGMTNVSFLGFQPEERFRAILTSADACLVTLQPGMDRLSAPSRAYTFLSAGQPIITMMPPDSELAKMVIETETGWNVSDGHELEELAQYIKLQLSEANRKGANARQLYEQRFTKRQVTAAYAELLTT